MVGPRLLRLPHLVGQAAVSAEQAEENRRAGRYPVKPRPGRDGMLPFKAATVWRKVRMGDFPAPVRIGGVTAWRAEEVETWISNQK